MQATKTIGSALAVALLLSAGLPGSVAGSAPSMKFGMDRGSIQSQADLGVKPDYAQFWAGVWSERSGWSGFATWADRIADQGITPVVEWWYWGDDISRSCVEHGCWSSLHDAWKSRAKWREDAGKLADALHAGLKGRPAIVVIESEFNKKDVATWETFDGYLAEHARIFEARVPEAKLVLGIGNWGSADWWRWDRAAAAMDMVGFQTMRGSTRDSYGAYMGTVDAIEAASAKLKGLFGKPVLLHDLALSSYGAGYEANQEKVLKELFARRGELKAAGVTGIVYRTMKDDPTMDPANYYGHAERHWGLKRADGAWKPSLNDWVAGIKAERASPAPAAPSTFDATFAPKGTTNNWWVEVKVTGNQGIRSVAVREGDGSWVGLPATAWGTHAKSLHVPDGTRVQFRAMSATGDLDHSGWYTWS